VIAHIKKVKCSFTTSPQSSTFYFFAKTLTKCNNPDGVSVCVIYFLFIYFKKKTIQF